MKLKQLLLCWFLIFGHASAFEGWNLGIGSGKAFLENSLISRSQFKLDKNYKTIGSVAIGYDLGFGKFISSLEAFADITSNSSRTLEIYGSSSIKSTNYGLILGILTKFGYRIFDDTLLYVGGGISRAKHELSCDIVPAKAKCKFGGDIAVTNTRHSSISFNPTVCAGVEKLLIPNLSLRIETLYRFPRKKVLEENLAVKSSHGYTVKCLVCWYIK